MPNQKIPFVTKEQVEQIFTTLQLELVKTKLRFLGSQERVKKTLLSR